MKSSFYSFPMVATCVALASSDCSADGASSPAGGPCKAETAQGLIGKKKTDRRRGDAADRRGDGSPDPQRRYGDTGL